jgi:hypothetical protein
MWLGQVFAEFGILLNDMAVGVDDIHCQYSFSLVDDNWTAGAYFQACPDVNLPNNVIPDRAQLVSTGGVFLGEVMSGAA